MSWLLLQPSGGVSESTVLGSFLRYTLCQDGQSLTPCGIRHSRLRNIATFVSIGLFRLDQSSRQNFSIGNARGARQFQRIDQSFDLSISLIHQIRSIDGATKPQSEQTFMVRARFAVASTFVIGL